MAPYRVRRLLIALGLLGASVLGRGPVAQAQDCSHFTATLTTAAEPSLVSPTTHDQHGSSSATPVWHRDLHFECRAHGADVYRDDP
jgi:hypothetical protein